MFVDSLFICMGAIRLLGDGLFADDEADGEPALTQDDLQFSDTALFGLFFANVLANGCFHAYKTVMTTDAVSFYFSIWTMGEGLMLFLTFILWKHAAQAQKRAARKARDAALAAQASANANASKV